MVGVLALVLGLALAPPFGEGAAVVGATADGGLEVRLSVSVSVPGPVVAILGLAVGEQIVVALAPADDGRWEGWTTLARPENARVAFEVIADGVDSQRSETVTLVDLGADPLAFVGTPVGVPAPRDEPAISQRTRRWGWLALAAGAAALALLAVWSLGRSGSPLDKRTEHPEDSTYPE